jgi:hypothetical protein
MKVKLWVLQKWISWAAECQFSWNYLFVVPAIVFFLNIMLYGLILSLMLCTNNSLWSYSKGIYPLQVFFLWGDQGRLLEDTAGVQWWMFVYIMIINAKENGTWSLFQLLHPLIHLFRVMDICHGSSETLLMSCMCPAIPNYLTTDINIIDKICKTWYEYHATRVPFPPYWYFLTFCDHQYSRNMIMCVSGEH